MPFTLAHPAILVPLHQLFKQHLSLSALIIGSMAPDFEYFIRMKVSSMHSHTFWGMFYFDLPIALVVFVIFHNILKNTLIEQLPRFLQSRIKFENPDHLKKPLIKVVLTLSISCLIGIFSHVLWNSFTHKTGFFVQLLPILQENLCLLDFKTPIFKVLQHTSTLLGGIYLVFRLKYLPFATQLSTNHLFSSGSTSLA